MDFQPRLAAAVLAVSLAALAAPALAPAAGLVPDTPAGPTPNVSVTPSVGSGGAGAEVGVGETTLHAGAGAGGVSAGTRPTTPTTSSPAATSSPSAGESLPVRTPGDRPATRTGGGSTGAVFSARSGGTEAGDGGRRNQETQAAGTSANRPAARDSAAATAVPAATRRSEQPPFFELVDRIPTGVKLGLVALALVALAMWASWIRARRRLEKNAFVDPVTGVANAAALEGLLARELDRARRYKRPLALLVLELSESRHNRLSHDQVLRDATAAIRERLREGATIARLGPSRFAVICPEATATSAETLRRALELRLEEMRMHVAVGTAERQPTDLHAADLLARAEAAIEAPEAAPARPRGRAVLRAA